MRPLGNEKHISLSRKWTKAMRKADKAKGRQDGKKQIRDGRKVSEAIDQTDDKRRNHSYET